jgi:hypothetical protein
MEGWGVIIRSAEQVLYKTNLRAEYREEKALSFEENE